MRCAGRGDDTPVERAIELRPHVVETMRACNPGVGFTQIAGVGHLGTPVPLADGITPFRKEPATRVR